jgi:hypothetical protein
MCFSVLAVPPRNRGAETDPSRVAREGHQGACPLVSEALPRFGFGGAVRVCFLSGAKLARRSSEARRASEASPRFIKGTLTDTRHTRPRR